MKKNNNAINIIINFALSDFGISIDHYQYLDRMKLLQLYAESDKSEKLKISYNILCNDLKRRRRVHFN